MKYFLAVVCALALSLSTQAQSRGMGMRMGGMRMGGTRMSVPARGMGVMIARPAPPRFAGVPRMRGPGFGPRVMMVRPVPGPRTTGRRDVIFTSFPFSPFFNPFFNSFGNPFFFPSGFCFGHGRFCNGLFFRNALFGGFDNFGAFSTFPFFGGFPTSPFVVAPPIFGFGNDDSSQARDVAAQQQQQQNSAITQLENELAQERQERRELQSEIASLRTPQPQPPPPTTTVPDAEGTAALLVFRDGTRTNVGNYAIVGSTLFAFAPHWVRKIQIADLDLPATLKANAARGIDFVVPHSGKAVTHP